jgi:hypothetical protein
MVKGRLLQTILAALVLVLVAVNILLVLGNQSIQAEVGDRQQFIAQAIQLEGLNRQVVGALANMALKTNDGQLKKLLAESGVSFEVQAEPARRSK